MHESGMRQQGGCGSIIRLLLWHHSTHPLGTHIPGHAALNCVGLWSDARALAGLLFSYPRCVDSLPTHHTPSLPPSLPPSIPACSRCCQGAHSSRAAADGWSVGYGRCLRITYSCIIKMFRIGPCSELEFSWASWSAGFHPTCMQATA
jgi:hypothetical protein